MGPFDIWVFIIWVLSLNNEPFIIQSTSTNTVIGCSYAWRCEEFSGKEQRRACTWKGRLISRSRSAFRTTSAGAPISTARRHSLQRIAVVSMAFIIQKQIYFPTSDAETLERSKVRHLDSPSDIVVGIVIDIKRCRLSTNLQGPLEPRWCYCCLR